MPGHEDFTNFSFHRILACDLKVQLDGAIAEIRSPDFGGEEIVQKSGRFEIAVKLRANGIDIKRIERAGIWQSHRAVHFRLGDLEKADVASKIDYSCMIDIRPSHPLFDRKSFSVALAFVIKKSFGRKHRPSEIKNPGW